MTHYLEGGWHRKGRIPRLRTEVIDGAIDVAGMLHRAGVPSRRLLRIALKVRSLLFIANPLIRGRLTLNDGDREHLKLRLGPYSDDYPELQGFLFDCVDCLHDNTEMTAFYLHLVHIARMMQLLAHAVGALAVLQGSPAATQQRTRAHTALDVLDVSTAKAANKARRKPSTQGKPPRRQTVKGGARRPRR